MAAPSHGWGCILLYLTIHLIVGALAKPVPDPDHHTEEEAAKLRAARRVSRFQNTAIRALKH